MPTDAARLISEAERAAQLIDRLGSAYTRELSRVLGDLERWLAAQVPADTITRRALIGRGLRLREEIRAALTEAGYDGLVERVLTRAMVETLEAASRTTVGRVARAFTPAGGSLRLEALYRLAADRLLAWADDAATAVWRTVAQGIFGARPRRELLEDLTDVLDGREAEAQTLYDTATATFTREAAALNADGTDDELFAYLGPVDSLMRPFCADHIGRVYSRAEIADLDNDTPGLEDVFLYGGGYNCRHTWMRVSPASELVELAGTTQRVPEIADALAEVEPKRTKAAKAA